MLSAEVASLNAGRAGFRAGIQKVLRGAIGGPLGDVALYVLASNAPLAALSLASRAASISSPCLTRRPIHGTREAANILAANVHER
jgi:hypothetical protein